MKFLDIGQRVQGFIAIGAQATGVAIPLAQALFAAKYGLFAGLL